MSIKNPFANNKCNGTTKHNFGKWEVYKKVAVFDKDTDKYPIYQKLIQLRSCKTCDFTETNTQKV